MSTASHTHIHTHIYTHKYTYLRRRLPIHQRAGEGPGGPGGEEREGQEPWRQHAGPVFPPDLCALHNLII